jgi:hypothetical protein
MVIQDCEAVAVQLHPAEVVTSTVFAPPAAAIEVLLGLNATMQDRPAWLTLNVCPPMSIEPVRTLNAVLAPIV